MVAKIKKIGCFKDREKRHDSYAFKVNTPKFIQKFYDTRDLATWKFKVDLMVFMIDMTKRSR